MEKLLSNHVYQKESFSSNEEVDNWKTLCSQQTGYCELLLFSARFRTEDRRFDELDER